MDRRLRAAACVSRRGRGDVPGSRELFIPRHFHWIWLGDRAMPARHAEWIAGWLALHPGWEHTIWTEANRPRLCNEVQYRAAANHSQKSDVLRYEVLLEHGGVYLDGDVQCCRNIEPLITGCSAFIGREASWAGVGGAVFGAIAGHPWVQAIVDRIPSAFEEGTDQIDQSGPGLITPLTEGRSDVAIFAPATFFPYHPRMGKPLASHQYPDAYAIHHFEGSWLDAPAERVLALAEIEEIVPPGAEMLAITATFGRLEVPGRVVVPFYPRHERKADHPADSTEAIRAFQRMRSPDLSWVVVHRWAFWWFQAYPEFCSFLESVSARVERRQWIVAYELRPA